jgi:hypothetical protein
MATLRITFGNVRHQLTPTFYSLQGGSEDPTENNYYYNVSRVALNMYLYYTGTVYCSRKIDFSGMADNEVKNIKGVGATIKITNQKDPSTNISMSANALQCVTWGQHLLANLSVNNINVGKQKLPQYILASDLAQLKENVLFHFLWGDNNRNQSSDLATKFLDITLNLFADND